ncbi:actin-3-like [Argonauta hians]
MWKLLKRKLKQVRGTTPPKKEESPILTCYETSPVSRKRYTNEGVPLVFDCGTGTCKIGFSGEDLPRDVFPTCTAELQQQLGTFSRKGRESPLFPSSAENVVCSNPVQRGVITNWDTMEYVWHQCFERLGVSSDTQPVLLSETPFFGAQNREKLAEILFETFDVPALYLLLQPVLALYGSGHWSGIVLDAGEGTTHIVPVFDGYPCNEAIVRFPMAGCDLTEQLGRSLQGEAIPALRQSPENYRTTVRHIKEKYCSIMKYEEARKNIMPQTEDKEYQIPCTDTKVVIGPERLKVPEYLFQPERCGFTCPSLQQSIAKSILRCHSSLQESMTSNIVLAGGTTLLPGMCDRLHKELAALSLTNIHITAPPVRKYSAWMGGSIVASLETFRSMWLRKDEYYEFGPSSALRKCSWHKASTPTNLSLIL